MSDGIANSAGAGRGGQSAASGLQTAAREGAKQGAKGAATNLADRQAGKLMVKEMAAEHARREAAQNAAKLALLEAGGKQAASQGAARFAVGRALSVLGGPVGWVAGGLSTLTSLYFDYKVATWKEESAQRLGAQLLDLAGKKESPAQTRANPAHDGIPLVPIIKNPPTHENHDLPGRSKDKLFEPRELIDHSLPESADSEKEARFPTSPGNDQPADLPSTEQSKIAQVLPGANNSGFLEWKMAAAAETRRIKLVRAKKTEVDVEKIDEDAEQINLRKYQLDQELAYIEAINSGADRGIIISPTGTGKTTTSSAIIEASIDILGATIFQHPAANAQQPRFEALRERKVLILVHRKELFEQIGERVGAVVGHDQVTYFRAREHNANGKVVVAMTQSLQGNLDKIDPDQFGLVLTDETHHSLADTYMKIYNHLGFVNEDGEITQTEDKFLLGVTATPERSDGEHLSKLFGKDGLLWPRLGENRDYAWFVKQGYLLRPQGIRIDVEGKPDSEVVVDAFERYGFLGDRPKSTLVFARRTNIGKKIVSKFQEKFGDAVKVGYVDGRTPNEERERVIDDFKNGQIDVVVNYGVLTEGFDHPGIEMVMVARPTDSRSLYVQMVGRGGRIDPEHTDRPSFLVVDFNYRIKGEPFQMDLAEWFGFSYDDSGKIIDLLEESEKRRAEAANQGEVAVDEWNPVLAESYVDNMNLAYGCSRYLQNILLSQFQGDLNCFAWVLQVNADQLNQYLWDDIPETKQSLNSFFKHGDSENIVSLKKLDELWQHDIHVKRYRTLLSAAAKLSRDKPSLGLRKFLEALCKKNEVPAYNALDQSLENWQALGIETMDYHEIEMHHLLDEYTVALAKADIERLITLLKVSSLPFSIALKDCHRSQAFHFEHMHKLGILMWNRKRLVALFKAKGVDTSQLEALLKERKLEVPLHGSPPDIETVIAGLEEASRKKGLMNARAFKKYLDENGGVDASYLSGEELVRLNRLLGDLVLISSPSDSFNRLTSLVEKLKRDYEFPQAIETMKERLVRALSKREPIEATEFDGAFIGAVADLKIREKLNEMRIPNPDFLIDYFKTSILKKKADALCDVVSLCLTTNEAILSYKAYEDKLNSMSLGWQDRLKKEFPEIIKTALERLRTKLMDMLRSKRKKIKIHRWPVFEDKDKFFLDHFKMTKEDFINWSLFFKSHGLEPVTLEEGVIASVFHDLVEGEALGEGVRLLTPPKTMEIAKKRFKEASSLSREEVDEWFDWYASKVAGGFSSPKFEEWQRMACVEVALEKIAKKMSLSLNRMHNQFSEVLVYQFRRFRQLVISCSGYSDGRSRLERKFEDSYAITLKEFFDYVDEAADKLAPHFEAANDSEESWGGPGDILRAYCKVKKEGSGELTAEEIIFQLTAANEWKPSSVYMRLYALGKELAAQQHFTEDTEPKERFIDLFQGAIGDKKHSNKNIEELVTVLPIIPLRWTVDEILVFTMYCRRVGFDTEFLEVVLFDQLGIMKPNNYPKNRSKWKIDPKQTMSAARKNANKMSEYFDIHKEQLAAKGDNKGSSPTPLPIATSQIKASTSPLAGNSAPVSRRRRAKGAAMPFNPWPEEQAPADYASGLLERVAKLHADDPTLTREDLIEQIKEDPENDLFDRRTEIPRQFSRLQRVGQTKAERCVRDINRILDLHGAASEVETNLETFLVQAKIKLDVVNEFEGDKRREVVAKLLQEILFLTPEQTLDFLKQFPNLKTAAKVKNLVESVNFDSGEEEVNVDENKNGLAQEDRAALEKQLGYLEDEEVPIRLKREYNRLKIEINTLLNGEQTDTSKVPELLKAIESFFKKL